MNRVIRTALENFGALILAALLFAASHPNIPFQNGLPLLAWISFIPLFWVIRRAALFASIFYGAFFGYISYWIFNYWLSVFHPLAGLIVYSIYLGYCALLFFVLNLSHKFFPRRSYIIMWIIWIAYEYLTAQGFLAYSYGITGYTQWRMIPIIQIADIAGVWAVSALVVFPSAYLAAALWESGFLSKKLSKNEFFASIKSFILKERLPAIIWLVFLAFTLVYGFASQLNYSDARTVRIALIQHNTDPWAPSRSPTYDQAMAEYRNDFNVLRRLSDEALSAYPDTDLVVWSETAFVPRIYWHTTFRNTRWSDYLSWDLVRDLLNYLSNQEVPFVIGNDDARRAPEINPDPQENHRIDYNAVMLYDRG